MLLVLRDDEDGVRPGVELGGGSRDSSVNGLVRDVFRDPRSGREPPQTQGYVAGASLQRPAGNAGGE